MAGSSDVDPAIRLNNTNMTLDLQHTLADKFRYGLLLQGLRLSTSAKGFTPTAIDNVTFALANLHPEIPFNTICPFGAIFRNSTKPGGCYLQNAVRIINSLDLCHDTCKLRMCGAICRLGSLSA